MDLFKLSEACFTAATLTYVVATVLYLIYMGWRNHALGGVAFTAAVWARRPTPSASPSAGSRPAGTTPPSPTFTNRCSSSPGASWFLLDPGAEIQAPHRRRLYLPGRPRGHGRGRAQRRQGHRPARPGPAKLLAPRPRGHRLARLRGLCRQLRPFPHVPDQGQNQPRVHRRRGRFSVAGLLAISDKFYVLIGNFRLDNLAGQMSGIPFVFFPCPAAVIAALVFSAVAGVLYLTSAPAAKPEEKSSPWPRMLMGLAFLFTLFGSRSSSSRWATTPRPGSSPIPSRS